MNDTDHSRGNKEPLNIPLEQQENTISNTNIIGADNEDSQVEASASSSTIPSNLINQPALNLVVDLNFSHDEAIGEAINKDTTKHPIRDSSSHQSDDEQQNIYCSNQI